MPFDHQDLSRFGDDRRHRREPSSAFQPPALVTFPGQAAEGGDHRDAAHVHAPLGYGLHAAGLWTQR